jgi:outer membrane receptor protein involved in Fe transport
MEFRRKCFIAQLCVSCFLLASAVAQQATVDLRGFITDASGASISGAHVTAVNTSTGISRTTDSLETGGYALAALPAGTYVVKVAKQGFAETSVEGVVLTVGQTATVNATLKIGEVSQTVDVGGSVETVNTQESYVGSTITQTDVQDLPLQSRQFANLAILTPGVTLAYNGDPTEANRLMPSIAGGRSRLTSFTIDNADDSEDLDGGLLYTVSLDAIQEFQVITHRFTAEQGRAAYGLINVITKSGGNNFHGSGFEFFRNNALNWRTRTEELNNQAKGDYLRNQYGGSFGGPIKKDRLFFFGAVERLGQNTINVVNTQGIAPKLDGPETLPQTLLTITGKVDAKLSTVNQLSLRYSRETNSDVFGANSLTPQQSQGANKNTYDSGVVNLTSVLGNSSVNQLTFAVTNWVNLLPPNSSDPTLIFPNGVTLGRGTAFPQSTVMKKFQLRDTYGLTLTGMGTHNLKIGPEYVFTPHVPSEYNTQKTPQYTFLGNNITSPLYEIYYNIGNGVFQTNNFHRLGAFVQDDWQVNRKLTLNLGVRWDYYGGVAFNQDFSPTYKFLQTVLPGFAGKQASNPKANFSPRVGFAYDPVGHGNTVIRGGYGYYYNFPILSTFYTLLGRNADPLRLGYDYVDPNGIKNPDGSFYQYGQPLPPTQLGPSPAALPDSVVDPRNVDPRYQHATIGFEQRVASKTRVGADFIWSRGDHLPFANQINRLVDGARAYAADGYNFPIRLEQTIGKSSYEALNVSFAHQYSGSFQLNAWYTFSKCRSTSVRASDEGFSSFPIDQNNPVGPNNYGPCALTPDNLLMVSPVWTLPHGLQLSSINRFSSGVHYNITAGLDLNADGVNNDIPLNVKSINSGVGANFFQSDVRVAKIFTLPREIGKLEGDFEMYNIFNNRNPASYVGNQQAKNFGQPTAFSGDPKQGEARLIQLGVRYTF